MNDYVTLQVAGTRFAITCSYPSFAEWLTERYHCFISQEEPHLRINIKLAGLPKGKSYSHILYITTNGHHREHGELELSMTCSSPVDFFGSVLQISLRCATLAKRPPDLLLHSAGIMMGGKTYLFSGVSGSGKSTACRLLSQEPGFSILHDDMISVSQTEEGFKAWSTPLRGEIPAKRNRGAPLEAAFFLKHSQTNYVTRLSGRNAAGQLACSLVPPLIATNGSLAVEAAESLRPLLALAESIPCYELHFRPENGFWKCIPQLFEKESVTNLKNGNN